MADPAPPKKKTKGQRKTEIKPIEDPKARGITFSKRRDGLFKKADALSTLTDADVALMVVSPGGKPFTYGSPDVDGVVARYKSEVPTSQRIEQQKAELNEITKQLAYEERRAEELQRRRAEITTETWMAAPPQAFSKVEKKEMTERLGELHKVLSQPPGTNSCGYPAAAPPPPPYSASFGYPRRSFTEYLTGNPGLQGISGLSYGSALVPPVMGDEYFGSNMVLTPTGDFYRGKSTSSSVGPAATTGNNMFGGNMMFKSFYTGQPSSMVRPVTQNRKPENNKTPNSRDNFYTGGSSSSLVPVNTQNRMPGNNMTPNSRYNLYTGGSSSSMVPVNTQNRMPGNNMTPNSCGNFYSGGSSLSKVQTVTQNRMSGNSMTPNSGYNFYTGGSSLGMVPPANTKNRMSENNTTPKSGNNFYRGGSSSSMVPASSQKRVREDSLMQKGNGNIYTSGSSSVAPAKTEKQMLEYINNIMMDDDNDDGDNLSDVSMRLEAYKNYFKSGISTEELTQQNQIIGENNMNHIPPQQHDNDFNTSGGSSVAVAPPADIDENIIVPPAQENSTNESSVVVPETDDDDESLIFDEDLIRLLLSDDDQLFGSSSSMVPPEQTQMTGGNVIPPPPPTCDGNGAGPSWFN